MMNQWAVFNFYSAVGLTVVSLLMAVMWFFIAVVGREMYKRVARVYHWTVLGYWLDRLEKEGSHCFQKRD